MPKSWPEAGLPHISWKIETTYKYQRDSLSTYDLEVTNIIILTYKELFNIVLFGKSKKLLLHVIDAVTLQIFKRFDKV